MTMNKKCGAVLRIPDPATIKGERKKFFKKC